MNHFKEKQFQQDVIIVAVGYYLRYNLSYREVQEILYARGINVSHTTIYRWVQEYVQKELKIKLYYATPSSPQQRGSNENRNRKLRDWYPKGTSFKDVKQRQLDEVASKMNAMPLRQALDGKRPMVVFEQEYKAMQRYRRAYEKRKQRMLEVKKQEFENN
ncbi:hypothetical protein FE409_08735 [Leuconostoc carnosum]|nr:hypothetical protein FE409_08735 [Leuconostoc carnosum]